MLQNTPLQLHSISNLVKYFLCSKLDSECRPSTRNQALFQMEPLSWCTTWHSKMQSQIKSGRPQIIETCYAWARFNNSRYESARRAGNKLISEAQFSIPFNFGIHLYFTEHLGGSIDVSTDADAAVLFKAT